MYRQNIHFKPVAIIIAVFTFERFCVQAKQSREAGHWLNFASNYKLTTKGSYTEIHFNHVSSSAACHTRLHIRTYNP